MGDLLKRAEKVFGPDSEMTLAITGNLAGALRQSGQLEASGPYYRRAYEGMRAKHGPDDRRTLMFQNNLGNFLWQSGQPEAAEREQRSSMEALSKMFGPEHPATAEFMFGLGRTLTTLKRRAEAIELLERAVAIRQKLLPADNPERLETEAALAAARALAP